MVFKKLYQALILLITVTLMLNGLGYAQVPQLPQSHLFSSDSVLEINLVADFKQLFKDKLNEPKDQPAELWYLGPEGDTVSMGIKLRSRGIFRRKFCSFTPLRLNFSKKKSLNTMFEGEDKLKLVTHCRSQSYYQSYVFKEYLTYRMYNLLSEVSLKVRLVKINYIYPVGAKEGTVTKYAFLIEDEEAMAHRNQSMLMNTRGLHPKYVDPYSYGMMAVFQYMIGNTDWNVPSQHNVKLLKPKDHMVTKLSVVPYDFDFSGFTNTTYSTPTENLPIKKVTDRLYRGCCLDDVVYQQIKETFNHKKEALYQLCQNFDALDPKERSETVKFLDQFYKVIESEYLFDQEIVQKCRNDYY